VVAPARPSWSLVAALLICAYGALLRLDALAGRYGTLDHPAWARAATQQIAPLARYARPASIVWGRVPQPYVGGDPYSYLTYAREMTSFYQPHVREPVFLATTKAALWSVDGQDAGISIASAAGSVAAIFATYLLGAALVSPAGGLIAAALLAIEYDAIAWSVEGWRDDTFTAFFVFAVWALVRFRQEATFGRALVLGVLGGLACLTRLTALLFIVPALVWIAIERREHGRVLFERTAVAIALLTAIVAPFLISCAIATGDPFFAVNYHTGYYRHAEGLPADAPMSAVEYVREKIGRRPIETLDVAMVGLVVRPMERKWWPYDLWLRGLTSVLRWIAVAGLTLWLFNATGRFLLFVLLLALAPYAFTWNLGGGGEWRFTMHVYSIYLVAAVQALFDAGAFAAAAMRHWRRQEAPAFWRPVLWRGLLVAAVAAGAVKVYRDLPWLVKREAIAAGEAVNVEAGARDGVFFRDGWSEPHAEGAVTVRVSLTDRAALHFPLPQKRDYEVTLRVDPVAPGVQKVLTVLFNHQLIGRLQLSWNPERIGSYRLSLPAGWVRAGDNEVELIQEALVAAADAGPRFSWLDPASRLGVRVWYLRVLD
jgi:4-amino-4-deoxy-L-arabinose transferase-like glycosyltransferase